MLDKLFQECLNMPEKLVVWSPVLLDSLSILNMFAKPVASLALASLVLQTGAVSKKQWSKRSDHLYLPKATSDYKTATAPNNVTIRYKNPGICETTPGVDSYSGYVDLSPDVCSF
jgi:hypothetical protein